MRFLSLVALAFVASPSPVLSRPPLPLAPTRAHPSPHAGRGNLFFVPSEREAKATAPSSASRPVGAASLRPSGAERPIDSGPRSPDQHQQESSPIPEPVGAASLRPTPRAACGGVGAVFMPPASAHPPQGDIEKNSPLPGGEGARGRGDSVRRVADLPMGDGAVTVGVGKGPIVFVGASSATRTVALVFEPTAVDRFVEEATALLKRGATPARRHTDDRVVLNDRAGAGSVSFSRVVTHHRAAYHFFFSDDPLTGFPLTATPIDVRAMLGALHRAARLTPES
jgi:hypothetical protein